MKARDDNCISIGEMEGLTLYEIFRYSYSGPLANNSAVQLYKSALCDCKDYPYIGISVIKKKFFLAHSVTVKKSTQYVRFLMDIFGGI